MQHPSHARLAESYSKINFVLLAVNLCVDLQDFFLPTWLPELQAYPQLSSLIKSFTCVDSRKLGITLKLNCAEL
jgi:hypothetical protein